MKRIITLVLACLLLLGLYGCESDPSLVGTTPIGDNAVIENTTGNNSKTFKLGDTVELDNVVVKFLSTEESNGSDFYKPAAGNVYVLCEFEIANNSKEELSVSSMLNFEAYCDDYSCEYSLGALMAKENKDQLDGTIAAGKKMKGIVGYEVPLDWKELEVHYSLGLLNNSEIVFVASNN